MAAADLYQRLVEAGKLIEALYLLVGQLRADKNMALEQFKDAPELTSLRIGPPDYLDWEEVAAPLEQLKAELGGGACVIVEINKTRPCPRPRPCYWLVGVDVSNDTVTIKKYRVGCGSSEEVSIIRHAGLYVTGRYMLARIGA